MQTFGADLCVKTSSDNKKYSLNIWCCGGHPRYRPLLEQFFEDASAIIICFDLLNTQSFLELPYWYNEYKRNAPDALVLLVGTKSDEADSIVVPLPDAMKQAKEWNIEFRAVSSKTGVNVVELFDYVVGKLP
ncbi:hypothetical protein HK097_003590 [Rhizophlyctis rosea]|uniref:Uncharacterized protein n=1 Tax=Rhizophlyctis rosea TaxID=64517 RepID=A0AAD5S392_9FUNG|nr:hypothetical protein HK097_003590 [Rhizophlyctis rosea]